MKKVTQHHIKQRRKIAIISMLAGLSLLLVSVVISFVFIQPTDFKQQFREQQLQDCYITDTSAEICNEKFSNN